MDDNRIFNFSAGPAAMPLSVLKKAADEMTNYRGSGMSVMEMSHRSKVYASIIEDVDARFRRVLGIPEGYKILYLQGGATLQFSMVPMNLMTRTGKADYAVTGNFSGKAAKEAEKYGSVHIAASSKDKGFSYIPAQSALDLSADASYFHYCMNNTIYGSTWDYIPDCGDVPVVTDASSCILSRELDVSKFGIIYAGAQKNLGPSGLTVVIIRDDLAAGSLPCTPVLMDYRTQIDNGSMYNTPSCYGIYMLGLVLEWIEDLGGLSAMRERNERKAKLLYDVIDSSSLYRGFIEKPWRSMMNVTFTTGSDELDAKFVAEAAKTGMANLKGHRALGAMRASIYNAMPEEGCIALAEFMRRFEKENA